MTTIDEHKKRVQALIKIIQVVAFIVAAIIVVVVVFTSLPEEKTFEEEQQLTTPSSEKIIFTLPAELQEAIEDKAYSYSFCQPDSARSGATCGGLAGTTTNPYGGRPPYSFSHQFGVGFIPTGLALELNGLLRGTPTLPGDYTFGVCVTDLYKEVCKTTSLTVRPESEQLEEVSPSVKIESATAIVKEPHYIGGKLWGCDCTVKVSGTATIPYRTDCTFSLEFGKCPSEYTPPGSCGIWTCIPTCPKWDAEKNMCIRHPDQPATGEWSFTVEDEYFDSSTRRDLPPEASKFTYSAMIYCELESGSVLGGVSSAWDSVTLTCCP